MHSSILLTWIAKFSLPVTSSIIIQLVCANYQCARKMNLKLKFLNLETLLPFLSSYHKLVYLEPDFPTSNNGAEIADCNFMISGRRCCFSPEEDVKVCYIGEEGATLTSLMLTLNRYTFYSYSVRHLCLRQEDLDVNQQLRKRYYLIEKARDAELFGILVATLGNS